MKGTIELINPIKINGKSVKKLTYDTNEITPALFTEADAKKMRSSGTGGNLSGAVEIDYGAHMYMGFAAVIAINSEYTFEDLERVKGRDMMKLLEIGRGFIMGSEDSPEGSSDEPSETTQEPTTLQ